VVSGENYWDEDDREGEYFIGVYSVRANRVGSKVGITEPAGTLMPVGDRVVGFYQHPKLIDISTGEIGRRWPEIDSGSQNSSIIGRTDKPPPMALAPAGRRFAVAGSAGIVVIQLG
jgi:hypothetical protein